MAGNTNFLGLILPESGEYDDTWNIPVNANFVAVDAKAQATFEEIQAARGTKGSLQAFLLVGHDSAGGLLPTKEVLSSRSSPIYGHKTDAGALALLNDRLARSEREIWWAREGAADLRASVAAARTHQFPIIVSGSKSALGYPSWLGSSANKVTIDGSAVPLKILIAGQTSQVRTKVDLTPVAAGTVYVQGTKNNSGKVVMDGTVAPLEGTTSLDTSSDMTIFSATSVTNWGTSGAVAGDILEITGNALDSGFYIIKETSVDGDPTKLRIYGVFPTGGLSSLSYKISDPLGATLTLATTETNSDTTICLGEADYDGTAITAVRPRAFGDTYVSEWRAVNVGAGSSGTFEELFSHGFGTNNIDIRVQASQTNTNKSMVEDVPMVSLTNTVAVSNTLAVSGAILTGGVTLTGSVNPTHGCICKWDGQKVYVKNAVANAFYTDYSSSAKQTGYIRVIARRRA